MSPSEEIKHWLNDYFNTNYCVLTGRGTSAIYILLKALKLEGTCVLVPAVTCPNVISAIVLAGYKPVFCDINLNDFNIDISGLVEKDVLDNVSVFLAIHSFGHLLEMEGIRTWCNKRKIFLIEDVCQLMDLGERGCTGDAAIVSFGYSKPIDCGDGGALLLRDISLKENVENELSNISEKPLFKELQEDVYKNLYYNLLKLSNSNKNSRILFKSLIYSFNNLYLYNISEKVCVKILKKLPELESLSSSRMEKTKIYDEGIKELPLRRPRLMPGSIPWRYTLLVEEPEHQLSLTTSLRTEGYNASNWYTSLSQDWGEPPESCPNADFFEKRVINLWVDDSVSNETVFSTTKHIKEYFIRDKYWQ